MSVPVELSGLAKIVERHRLAYLTTTNAKGAPHVVEASVALEDAELVVSGIGRRTRENAAKQSMVCVLWPPRSEHGYTLIVDGQAAIVDERLRIVPTRAVLHRPSPSGQPAAPGSCGADCVEIALDVGTAGR